MGIGGSLRWLIPRGALRKNCASWADHVELRRSLEALASRIDRELDPIIRASWEDQEPAVEAKVHRIQWAIHELEKGDLGVGLAA